MAELITNLRNRPQAIEYAVEQAGRGPGQLDSINAYLRNDPISYFYQKLSDDKNEFLRDDFWLEAAKRGESENLIDLLQKTGQENFSREAIDAISGYGARVDYDAYMLALQLPHLDNVKKKKRIDEDQWDEEGNQTNIGTGYEFGEYTDQEWAWEILKHTMGRWDAEIIEEDKANRHWLASLGTQVVAGLTNVVAGSFQFVGDIWNLGEGLLNMMFNWSNDADVRARFLQAFSNDSESWSNPFARIGEWLNAASFEFQRLYATTVNAEEAHDTGYRLGEGSNFLTQIDRSVGVGAGYTTWGRWMNAGTNAIGYMLPTILLGVATGTAAKAASAAGKAVSVGTKALAVINKTRSAIFYTGIFSGMMKDTVMNAQMNGISYRDLDAGKVLANAALKAAAQFAIEKALGMVLGFSGVDRLLGMGGKTIAKAGTKAATATVAGGLKAAGRVVATGAKDAIKEGLEEVFQELSDIAIDYAFGGTYRERAIENLSIQTITDAFVVGALTSVVMGSLRNVTTFIGTNRGIGVDSEGKAFKLGAFQTMNLREAISQMHEWNETINKKGGSVESKAKAMLSMNAAIATLGDVYKNMGTERALKADAMIMEMLNMESKTEQIAALGSNIEYANKIWADFKKAQAEATAKYVTQKIEDKIKKALEKDAAKLKDKKVTEISDVVTTETVSNDPAIPIEQDAIDKFKKALKALGVEVIVGVNGNIVSKSGEVVFANNKLVQAGDIENIVKGVAYDLALETVKANLNPSQKKMIIDAYSKVTGVEGTLDDATIALLFDKQFYTFVLLKSKERRYKTAAFEVLATIDKLIKAKLTPNIKTGTITESAYKTLLTKVQKTMRTGLVTFATHYNMIDLGVIDNAVLPAELKREIANHKNVRFTQTINDGVADRTNAKPSSDRIAAFDEAISKFASVITTEEMNWAKELARSSNYNDRVDAYMFLIYQTKKHSDYADKVIFLPSDVENVEENMFIQEVANDFGVAWTDLIAGTYNPNSLPVEIQNFIQSNGYDMNDTQSRLSAIREVLFNKSGKTLTIGMDGTVIRVLDKTELAFERYLGPKGQKNLHADLKSGKVKTLQDLSKVALDKRIGSLKLILDPSSVRPGINGYYIDGSGQIVLAGTDILNTIMHEATHATQFELGVGVETIQGGTADTFSLLPQKVQDSLTRYLKNNFELTYTTLKNPDTTNSQVLYFMLAGELQANASLSSFMFEVGFRWKDNRTKLVSPDGKMEWSMAPSKRKASAALKQVLQSAKNVKPETSTETIEKNNDQRLSKEDYHISFSESLDTSGEITDGDEIGRAIFKHLKARRLTPLEQGRLMGVKDADFANMAKNMSDRTLYHLTGDSIVVNILTKIFEEAVAQGITTKPVSLIEFFAGYGSQNLALKYAGIEYESHKIAEWAIPSIQAYKNMHHTDDTTDYSANMTKEELVQYLSDVGVSQDYNSPLTEKQLSRRTLEFLKTVYNNIQATHNLVNIQKVTGASLEIVDPNKKDTILTYSFPCQDLSSAGRQKGMSNTDTRSGLLWEVDRILTELQVSGQPMPKMLVMENVVNIHNKRNIGDFNRWIDRLKTLGYTSTWQDMKASDYGIPQSRIRTIMVSVLGDTTFKFPKPIPLTISTQDLLETKVPEKYFLSGKQIDQALKLDKPGQYFNYKHPINLKVSQTLITTQSTKMYGANLQSSKVVGEQNLWTLLHPRTEAQLEKSLKVLNDAENQGEYFKLLPGMNEDAPLTPAAKRELQNDPAIEKFMKNGWLKRKDKIPMVFYRGAKSEKAFGNQNSSETARYLGEFYTNNYKTAATYGVGDLIRGYINNATKDQSLLIFANGAYWWDLSSILPPKIMSVYTDFVTKYKSTLAVIPDIDMSVVKTKAALIKALGEAEVNRVLSEIQEVYSLSEDKAVRVLSSASALSKIKGMPVDTLALIGTLLGKDVVIIVNIIEEYDYLVTDAIFLNPDNQKRVTFENSDINWDKVGETDSRYIANKIARWSNLKYFIRKGVPIQMHPKVAAFISATTKDFDKLPKILQTKITNGKLNFFDITDYVATASNMNDYTFKAIAKYIYDNTELAKITYKEARVIMKNVEELAMLANLPNSEIDKHMTPSQMVDLLAETMESAKTDSALSKAVLKATKAAQTVKLVGKEGKSYFTESHAEGKQLNPILFRHYDGTLQSVRSINNLGKFMSAQQTDLEFREDVDTGKIVSSNKQWNWIDKLKKAEVDYEQDSGVVDALEDIDRSDKEKVIGMYVSNEISRRLESLPLAERQAKAAAAMKQLQKILNTISNLSEEALNKRYLAVLANEGSKPTGNKLEGIVKPETEAPRSIKNIKDHLRQAARTVTKRIAGLKRRYNSLPQSVRNAIDPATYKLNKTYQNMERPELESLLTDMKEAAKHLNTVIKNTEFRKQQAELAQARMARMAKKRKVDNKGQNVDPDKKQTMREKINIVHKTKVINQEFTFESREETTSTAKKLLSTQWGKQRMSQVQGLTNNQSQNVHNGKVFFEQNAVTLLSQSVAEAEATAKWFMDANMVGVAADSIEAQTFQAIKLYYLGYVLSEIKDGGQFYGMNPNTKTRIENHLKSNVTNAGTALAVWNNIQGLINPIDAMKNADMEIAGVILTDTEKEALLDAAVSGDMDAILKAQKEIIDRVNKEKTTKKGILRKIITVRSMAMLSGPITWLRNVISNMLLKRLNKASSAIGNKVFTKKTVAGQFKMDGKITPEIQAFINEHFIDNKLFDTLVSNLSKYNPSDIQQRFKDATGQASKDAIFANMVIKSMYNQFYNQNMFKSPIMNKLHRSLMKVLSDNNYVREASIRYFGKIIAERGYEVAEYNDDGTIKKNDEGKIVTKPVTDAIMTDFANAIGMGMADYMHSDNIFNKVETLLAEKSEGALFAYKLLLPFASASWNWFKAAIRYSPIGLAQSIFKLATLEKQIIKAETDWAKGKGQISPEMTEYLIRRNLGSGVIGTIAFGFGAILAGLGYVDLEDDDYGTPKLRIGNLRIDLSTIFGSSSVLAGMALVKEWQNEGFLEGVDAMLDPLLDGFFLTQILEMDQYSQGGFASFGLGFLEQTILSFIPNGIRWLSGATYSGKYKTTNLFERAVTRIPFLGAAFNVPKQTNPYTGDQGSMWDAFNRIVPFLEVRKISAIEENSKAVGINKTQLRGKYEINGEKFELSSRDTAELNKQYGEWNALALSLFYDNKSAYSVQMPNGTYRTLTYNQMTEDQRKRAVQNIMSKNAEYAKIQAWLKAGNTYYASASDYAALRKLGVTGKLYKGNKGFVKK